MYFAERWKQCKEHLKDVLSQIQLLQNSTNPADLLRAATELVSLGAATRGSTRPRGTLLRASRTRLPEGASEQCLLAALGVSRGVLRQRLILACSEWGGEASVRALAEILKSRDVDDVTKAYSVEGLKVLGGRVAVAALLIATAPDFKEPVERAALRALEELRTGGSIDDAMPGSNTGIDQLTPKAQLLDRIDSLQSLIRSERLLENDPRQVQEFRAIFMPAMCAYPELPWVKGLTALCQDRRWLPWAEKTIRGLIQEARRRTPRMGQFKISYITDTPYNEAAVWQMPVIDFRQGIWFKAPSKRIKQKKSAPTSVRLK